VSEGRTEAIVARLHGLYPSLIDLSLDRLRALLAKLGHPERRLPPVIHVAGTNGKGSTCAFLRAIGEAAGLRVHVYTSPHLVRFNERIRLAGRLVDDDALGAALEEIERVNAGAPVTVFEVVTAAALHLFARALAELCVLEVGLGGRGDATNVIARPASCAITSISLDHRELLGETLGAIAAEKAGIMKPGVPVAIGAQPPDARGVLLAEAARAGAPVRLRERDWRIAALPTGGLRFEDSAGLLDLPAPMRDACMEAALGRYDAILSRKGCTNTAIAACLATIVASIVNDDGAVYPVSVRPVAKYGIAQSVALALPCSIGRSGIKQQHVLPLRDEERFALGLSAATLMTTPEPRHSA